MSTTPLIATVTTGVVALAEIATQDIFTTLLCGAVGAMWIYFQHRADKCETDRDALRKAIEELRGDYGMMVGEATARARCPSQACPFKTQTIPKSERPVSLKEATQLLRGDNKPKP